MKVNMPPINKNVNLYKMNKSLRKKIKKMVKEQISKEFRKDAMYILDNCDKKTVMDFLFFALSNNGNLTCLCLDFAKDKEGNHIQTDSFGNHEFII